MSDSENEIYQSPIKIEDKISNQDESSQINTETQIGHRASFNNPLKKRKGKQQDKMKFKV